MDIIADRVDRLACAKCGHHMDLSDVAPFADIVCPQCNTKQVAPMRLGSFLLIAEMGKGGMGSVFRAFDQTLGRYVAIKVMQRHLADDRKFAENFLREARAAAALNHPYVVQIYSCGQERGQLYIVMELVDGGRLDKMIEGGKALDEVFTLEVGVQIAQGLEAANDIGLIHGDIKPANILFDKQQRAKVVDFGLARFQAQQHLQPGEIWGTPYYIAPEKVRAQKEDQRADIYSLGATLYHVLAGHPPFEGDTAKDVVLARLKDPAISLRTVRPSLQPETAEVIARTLEQDPSLRYPTYKSLLADLEEALRVARSRHGMPPADEGKKSRVPLFIGAAMVLALAGGAYYFLGDRNGEEPAAPPVADPVIAMPGQPADPAVPTPAGPEVTYAVQPFNESAQGKVNEAVTAWQKGAVREYESAFADLFSAMPRVGVERPWAGVLQALPSWMEQRESDMNRYLRGIQDATLRDLEGDQAHPGAMPQALARFMLGRLSADELQGIAGAWPAWFGDIVQFLLGADRLRAGALDEARRALTAFTERSASEPAWPYFYQAVAAEWVEAMDALQATVREAEEQEPEQAMRTLKGHRAATLALLRGATDQAIAKAEQRVRDDAQRRKEEETRAHAALVQADLETIESARAQLYRLVQARDFRQAGTRLRQLASPLETDEGRAAFDLLLESYGRMDELRRFIVQGLQQNPVPQSAIPELGGDALSATIGSGIRISLGGHGWRDLPWEQVSERLMASLAEYHLSALPEKEQADMTLSLAVFAYQSRGLRPAQVYTERAIALDGALRGKARELMPDLNWD